MPKDAMPAKARILREIRRVGRQLSSPFLNAGPPVGAREKLLRRAAEVTATEGLRSALPLWEAFWTSRNESAVPARVSLQFIPSNQPGPGNFDEVTPAPVGTEPPRFCVYTTLFGNYDDLKPPVQSHRDIDFICFTDQDINVPGWTTRRLASEPDPRLQGKRYKFFPSVHLAAYEASLFVDANILICGDLDRFIRRWCAHEDFVMWRHHSREDAADEAIAILVLSKHEPRAIVEQIEVLPSRRDAEIERNGRGQLHLAPARFRARSIADVRMVGRSRQTQPPGSNQPLFPDVEDRHPAKDFAK